MIHRCRILLSFALVILPVLAWAETSDNRSEFSRTIEGLLQAREFDKLEAIASELRNPDVRFSNSNSKIRLFYSVLAEFQSTAFKDKETVLNQWLSTHPKSLTSRVALAELLIEYAWVARGNDYASKVTPEQWKLFGERMQLGLNYIKGLNPSKDPYIYEELLTSGEAMGMPRAILDKLYMDAAHDFPGYYHFYAIRAGMLQEKWYGRPGELATFTRSLLTSPGGHNGQIAYSYVTSRLFSEFHATDLFTYTGLSWPQIKEAFLTRDKAYPLENADWNRLLHMAVSANDHVFASEALKHIGKDRDENIWDDKGEFEKAVSWVDAWTRADAAPAATGQDQYWLKTLPVEPGTSLQNLPLPEQQIYLEKKADFKLVQGKAWLSGSGALELADHKMFTNSGARVEVTLDDTESKSFKDCESLLNNAIPDGSEIILSGHGRYKQFQDASLPYQFGLGVFELVDITQCKFAPYSKR